MQKRNTNQKRIQSIGQLCVINKVPQTLIGKSELKQIQLKHQSSIKTERTHNAVNLIMTNSENTSEIFQNNSPYESFVQRASERVLQKKIKSIPFRKQRSQTPTFTKQSTRFNQNAINNRRKTSRHSVGITIPIQNYNIDLIPKTMWENFTQANPADIQMKLKSRPIFIP